MRQILKKICKWNIGYLVHSATIANPTNFSYKCFIEKRYREYAFMSATLALVCYYSMSIYYVDEYIMIIELRSWNVSI